MKLFPKIYYISQGKVPENQLANIELVCKAGVKFVQLRLKDLPITTIAETANKAQEICLRYDAQLFINDYPAIAQSIVNVGLHIGKNDLPMLEAKAQLTNCIIGGTANTLEDCINLAKNGADYIGLGPFQYTDTKKNLDPILGFSGYKEILKKLNSLKIHLPIYAIGGIEEKDIQPLLKLGLTGVAVSSLLTNKTSLEITKIINQYD